MLTNLIMFTNNYYSWIEITKHVKVQKNMKSLRISKYLKLIIYSK